MIEKTSQALTELLDAAKGTDGVALELYLDAVEDKRREDNFLKYWVPFEYEKKAIEAFKPGVKILVICGGNRSGKTEVGAAITMAFALGKEYFKGEPAWEWVKDLPIPEKRSRNIWMVGLDYKVLRDVIWREKLLTGLNHPGFLPKDAHVKSTRADDQQAIFADGTTLTGKSADSGREKFQSASVDLVWIDEECDASVFDECYQRTVDCGGLIVVTVTPLTDISSGIKEPWLFNLFESMKGGRSDVRFVNLSVLDNPVVPAEEKIKLIEKWKGHPEEKSRLFGEFVRRSGLVYPMWSRQRHLVTPHSIEGSPYRIVSIDPAATGTTAALWGMVDLAGNITLYKEYYEKDLVVSDHVRNIVNRNKGDVIDMWLIDPKWGQQRNAETHKTGAQLYRDNGLPVRLAEVGEDFGLNSSLEYMQATVTEASRHPKLWVFNSLRNFIQEVEHYVWDFYQKGNMKGLTKEKPRKREDHLMNAFQYMTAMKPRSRQRLQTTLSEDERARAASRNSYF